MTIKEYRALAKRRRKPKVAKGRLKNAPNSNELSYLHGVLNGVGQYEPVLRITPLGVEYHKYTPDFLTVAIFKNSQGEQYEVPIYHEVKGAYRFDSQSYSRLRWISAAINYPSAIFVWAKHSHHTWDIEIVRNGGTMSEKSRDVVSFSFDERGNVIWKRRNPKLKGKN